MTVGIVGAGLGGLTAALSLLHKGIDVAVYEQAQQLGEVGAGVQIGPNAVKVLEYLGLMPRLQAVAFKPARKVVRIWNTGESFPAVDLSEEAITRYGAPYLTLHRADLHGALLEAVREAKPDAVATAHKLCSVEQEAEGVAAIFENGSRIALRALIGADGIHSQVRQSLFGNTSAVYSGMMSWRGVIPMERLPQQFAQAVATNWVGPSGHIVHYPLRRGELMNVNAVVERTSWSGESWTMRGETTECLRDFAGWHPDVHRLLSSIDRPFQWALLNRPPLERWSVGRVTLLGDACHSMVPFLAQGASIAIEDGLVVARCIKMHEKDIPRALGAYEEARRDRAYRVVRGSADNIERFHNPRLTEPLEAADYIRETWGGNRFGKQLDWIFSYDARNVQV